MYTGIIEHIGTVAQVQSTSTGLRLVIDRQGWAFAPKPGDSVAINGCCLTLADPLDAHNGKMPFDAIPETLEKTTMGRLKPGDRVNLEAPLCMGDRLDGHTVQGHVDARGVVVGVFTDDGYRIRVQLDNELMRFMIPKGSVTLEGVSLTLAAIDPKACWFEVALIPETLERTTLADRKPGDAVNIEADMMVKTIVHTMEHMQQVKS
ncbi:MAG: riboflavin synthase [Phycisphaerales bacterium]|nr:riboflavin synthase [Phycisphaerales bacterium]